MLDSYIETLARKANETVASDIASAGVMLAKQRNAFFRKLIARSKILGGARTFVMDGPTAEIDKVFMPEFLQKPADEITAVTVTKPIFSKTTLTAQEFVGEARLSYKMLEDNIEKEGFADTLVAEMAKQSALQFAKAGVRGDTTGSGYLSILDGVLKQLNGGNIYNAQSAGISLDVFADAIKTLPDEYRDNLDALRFYVALDQETAYRQTLAGRMTGLGDAHATGRPDVAPFGVGLEGEVAMTATQGLLIDPSNILVGFHRQVTIKTDDVISERYWKVVLSFRADVKVEETDGVVRIDNLAQAL
jgi:hypothetical protein